MESAEASGKTVDDAIERALAQMGASRDEVEFVVLEEGKRSFLGRGGHDAVVRVTRLPQGEKVEGGDELPDTRIPRTAPRSSGSPRGSGGRGPRSSGGRGRPGAASLDEIQPKLREEDFIRPRTDGGPAPAGGGRSDSGGRDSRGGRERRPQSGERRPDRPDRPASSRPPRPRTDRPEVAPDINAPEVDIAAQVVDDILRLLDINAEITIREPLTPGDGLGSVKAVIDLSGDDLGLLIGRRGDTLVALQYLVNLIVTRQVEGSTGITIDIEHYRHRREEQIVSLARRMADRVREVGTPITLEPMAPAERRIIHVTLADDPEILTNSIGEGESRKVVISRRE